MVCHSIRNPIRLLNFLLWFFLMMEVVNSMQRFICYWPKDFKVSTYIYLRNHNADMISFNCSTLEPRTTHKMRPGTCFSYRVICYERTLATLTSIPRSTLVRPSSRVEFSTWLISLVGCRAYAKDISSYLIFYDADHLRLIGHVPPTQYA